MSTLILNTKLLQEITNKGRMPAFKCFRFVGVIPCAFPVPLLPKVHLLGHCVAGDEHRSSELLMVDKSIFSVGLQTPGQKN